MENNNFLVYIKKFSYTFDEKVLIYISHNKILGNKFNMKVFNFLTNKIIINKHIEIKNNNLNFNEFSFAEGEKWTLSWSFNISKDNFKKGIYILSFSPIETEKFNLFINEEPFCIPFYIFDCKNNSSNLIISNTNTWNAYNLYGNASFYRYYNKESKYSKINNYNETASNKVSFMRPFLTISSEINNFYKINHDELININNISDKLYYNDSKYCEYNYNTQINLSHLFLGESKLWIWLFKNNIDFDVVTDIDIENIKMFNNRKCIFLNCHPEYWTHKMYYNLCDSLINKKINLIYLGGNAIFRKVYYNNSDNSLEKMGYPFSDKNVLNNYTSTFQTDIFAKNNKITITPNKILGIYFDKRGMNVPIHFQGNYKCIDNDSFIFKGINLEKNEYINKTTHFFPPDGLETDKINSQYLSKEQIKSKNCKLLAKGTTGCKDNLKNEFSGGGDIVFLKFNSSKIFSCGSIYFTTCLNDNNITIMLKNVIKDLC